MNIILAESGNLINLLSGVTPQVRHPEHLDKKLGNVPN